MHTFVFPSCLLLVVGLSSFQSASMFKHPTVEKNMPRVGRKQARQVWLETIETYAKAGQWRQLGHIAKAAIEDQVSVNKILEIAEKIQSEPFLRAIVATQNMRALAESTGIAKSELFRIALYIETEFEQERQTSDQVYFSRRNTGLERTLEYDPESKLIFIHLKDHGVDEIGRGVKKIVTKSILYDVQNPEFVARCTSTYNMQNEIAALRYMQGARGIVRLFASSERTTKDGVKVYNIMCKLYEGGTLSKAFSSKYKFSFKQKLDIASDLLEGLSAIHAKGLVHRDLTSRNVLLDLSKKGKRKNRMISAVIADFGRVKHIDTANGAKVQFNSRYLAPEGIIAEKLSGEDYFATDLFALGCILHKLHFEKSGPWVDKVSLKNPTQPDVVKEAKFIYDLERYREVRLSKLVLNRGYGTEPSTGDRVEHLILQMIHPNPEKRGTAREHAEAIRQIIQDYEQRALARSNAASNHSQDESEDVSIRLQEATISESQTSLRDPLSGDCTMNRESSYVPEQSFTVAQESLQLS